MRVTFSVLSSSVSYYIVKLFRVKRDEPKWLETALYIDHSVIEFHGVDTVQQYILTLINIVSAIYGDPTLGADLKVYFKLIQLERNESVSRLDIIILNTKFFFSD